MKRILPLFLVFLSPGLSAQTVVTPEADVQFHSALVNNEFDASGQTLAPSLTIATLRLAPYVGLRFGEHHRLKAGVNVCQDFGTAGSPLDVRLAAWYQMDREKFTLAAGIYPRSLMKGRYSSVILSDKVRFYNALMEGLMLQWHGEHHLYELALDWNGKKGADRREQFNVITSGRVFPLSWLTLNWEGMLHHYASSAAVEGVVDDMVFHPYVGVEMGNRLGLQRLAVEVGAIAGYHNDRRADDLRVPFGADIVVDIRNWGAGVKNEAYYGGSQAPFYTKTDAAGQVYGNQLYMRNSQWQITPDSTPGFYDKLDIYWAPKVGRAVTLRVNWSLQFGYGGFLGHQQILEAIVNLDRISLKRKQIN